MNCAARKGIVLVAALLCILAVEVTAIGLNYATLQELRTARSATRDAQLRLAARSAIAVVISQWPADTIAALGLSARLPVETDEASTAGITTRAVVERISPTLVLVRGYAVSTFRETTAVALLVGLATPADLAAPITHAIVSNGEVLSLQGSRVTGGVAAPDSASQTVIGTLTFDRLSSIASRASSPQIHHVRGSVVLDSIAGAGLWVMDGDVKIRGGRIDGVIVARGNLTVADATIRGTIIASDARITLDDATVTFDATVLLSALSAPQLLGPYRPRGRMWIPLF